MLSALSLLAGGCVESEPTAPSGERARVTTLDLRLERTIAPPEGAGSILAFSPDGGRVLTESGYRRFRAWETATGKEVLYLAGHQEVPADVVFSPDGRWVATSSSNHAQSPDHNLKLWDARTGKLVYDLEGHGDSKVVYSLAFSPDSKWLASSGTDDNVRLWDVKTGKQLRSFPCSEFHPHCISLSPDGRGLAVTDNDIIRLLDPTGTRPARVLTSPEGGNLAPMQYSPDGRLLAAGWGTVRADGSSATGICLWNPHTGQYLGMLNHPSAGGSGPVSFHPSGRWLLGYDQGALVIWDLETKSVCKSLSRGEHTSALFSPDGKHLAVVHPRADLIDIYRFEEVQAP